MWPVCKKTKWFVRFDGSVVGLNSSMPVWSQNGSLRWIEPESSSVDGRTGWFGPIFKTMIATIILRCPLTCHNFNFLSLSWRVEIKLAFASLSLIWKFWWLHWGDHVLLKVVVAVVQLVSVIDSPVQLFICNFISLLFVFCQSVRKYNRSKFESFKTRENKNVYIL